MVGNLFRNARERRLRLVWRLALQTLLLIIFYLGASIFLSPFLAPLLSGRAATREGLTRILSSNPPVFAVSSLGTLLAVLTSVALAGRFIDRRRLSIWFGLGPAWWSDFAFGLVLGAFLMGLIFLVELAAGWITIDGTLRSPGDLSFGGAILIVLAAFICVGIYEELLVRGYYLKNLAEGFGALGKTGATITAMIVSSAVFGVAHATNPNATLLSSVLVGVAGLFLALGTVLTGRLALSIGLHITWNFFEGNVFGFPVSGTGANATTFIAVQQGGRRLVTGGAFGPEAGLIGLGAIILGSLLIVVWVRWRAGRVGLAGRLTTPDLISKTGISESDL
jgi:membrane protease YdiL (CAAX protease family)